MWRAARASGRMTRAEAARLLGKTGFALTPASGRVGRAATLALVQRQHHDITQRFTDAMAHAHDFFEALLATQPDGRPRLPDLVVPLAPDETPPLLVYTDAAYSRKRHGSADQCDANPHLARLGFVVYDPTAWDAARGARLPRTRRVLSGRHHCGF